MPERFSSADWEEDILIGCLIHENEQCALFLMFNAGTDAVDFGLPQALPGRCHQPFLEKGVAIVKQPRQCHMGLEPARIAVKLSNTL